MSKFRYWEQPDKVRQLKRDGDYDAALRLLFKCILATEAEELGMLAPWYTEQAAIIFRKRKEYALEVEVIERYLTALESRKQELLAEGYRVPYPTRRAALVHRLGKAQELREKHGDGPPM